MFGWLHILVLVLAAGSIVGLYYLRSYLRRPLPGRIFRYTIGSLGLLAELAFELWLQSAGEFRWVNAIPLGLCHIMNYTTAIALLFDLDRVIKVVLPWAFVGATLSFVVVDMGAAYTFPHFRFFHYFGNHWLFLVGNLFYLFTGRFTYRYPDLLRSTAWLGALAAVVLTIDLATDTNNMFLREWPVELDFVNRIFPFPLNTLLLILGIFAMFNIFYLIFVAGRTKPAEVSTQTRPAQPAGTR